MVKAEVLMKKVTRMFSALNGCHQDSAGSSKPGGHPIHPLDHKCKCQGGEEELAGGEGGEEEEGADLCVKLASPKSF